MYKSKSIKRSSLLLLSLVGLFFAGAGMTQHLADQVVRAGPSTSLQVPLFKSRIVELPAPAKRISVGNPDIADILILRSSQLYVLGKDLGTTNVLLWDKDDYLISAVSVHVTHDLEGLKRQLGALVPGENIEVYSVQRNIVLSGQVSSAVKMVSAVKLAESYLEQAGTAKDKIMFEQEGGGSTDEDLGEVINMMSVGGAQQVMLEVKVAELQRTEMRKLDTQLSALFNNGDKWVVGGVNGGPNGGATFPDAIFAPDNVRIPVFGDGTRAGGNPTGPAFDEYAPGDQVISDTGLFAGFLSTDFLVNLVIDAAKEQGLAKILAEPTLTTLSGQEAEFLSGGEFPIPVPQQNNVTTIEFKEFGVGLRFVPVILDTGRINLTLNIEVSELGPETVIQTGTNSFFRVPQQLFKRKAISTVELSDGQTMGIAGLINENLREVVNKFPGLGDIPILGHLFRSQEFQKGETELVILVTPRLAKPLAPSEIRLPTDSFIEPSDAEFYILGRMEGRSKKTASAPAGTTAGGAEGSYGHSTN